MEKKELEKIINILINEEISEIKQEEIAFGHYKITKTPLNLSGSSCKGIRVDLFYQKDKTTLSFIFCDATMLFFKSTKNFRVDLLNSKQIIGIFTLSQKIFTNISVRKAIILLGKNTQRIWLTKAHNFDEIILNLNNEFSKKQNVHYIDELDINSFIPGHYHYNKLYENSSKIEISFAKTHVVDESLIKEVYTSLVKAGFKEKNFKKLKSFKLKDAKIWFPDLTYSLEKRQVYFEVYSNPLFANADWIEAMKMVFHNDKNCFFVLTNGETYDIHKPNVTKSLLLKHTPTEEEILDWDKTV